MTTLRARISMAGGLFLAGLAVLAQAPTAARADATDEAWQRDADRKADEEWRKSVYGDPYEDAMRNLWSGDAGAAPASTQRYAALAYSASTGKYGYSWSYGSLAAARQAAVRECKAADARPVIWAQNGLYYALAVGKDGSAGATAATAARAKATALRECQEHTSDCKIVFCFFAGD